MKILVTGAKGFVGKNLCAQLKNIRDGKAKNYGILPARQSDGVSEAIFKVGMCLPAGPYVTDEDVAFIVETIKDAVIID